MNPGCGVALIGCGRIGRKHARNLASRAPLDLCSPDAQKADRLRAQVGGRRVFTRYEDALASPDVGAVVLATPPHLHAGQILQAIEAGKHVLVEKPMCTTPDEVALIQGALDRWPGSLLMVAENYYYKPSVHILRKLLDDGAIGPIVSMSVAKQVLQESTGWKSELGALLEGGIHFVALISGLVEQDPVEVTAEFPGRIDGRPERHSITRLTYGGGITAVLRYAWDTPALVRGLFQHSRIVGRDGEIVFESNGLYGRVKRRSASRIFVPGLVDVLGYRAMIDDFLACLEDRSRTPRYGFTQARRDLNVVFRAYGIVPSTPSSPADSSESSSCSIIEAPRTLASSTRPSSGRP